MAYNNNHFNLTLDTTKPTGGISMAKAYTNSGTLVTNISYTAHSTTGSDLNCAAYMQCWISTTAVETEVPSTVAWEIPATSKSFTETTEGTYYTHVKFVDEVGNESVIYNSDSCKFDETAPIISAFTVKDNVEVTGQPANETNSLTNIATVTFSDNLSGVNSLTFTCSDLTTSPYTVSTTAATSYSGNLQFKIGTAEGSKTITVTAKDRSGNVSAVASSTVYYDPDAKNMKLVLYKQDGSTSIIDNFYNQPKVHAKIVMTSSHNDIIAYQIWGHSAVTTDPGENTAASWVTCTPAATIDIGEVTFAAGDATKTLNIRVKDHLGNTNVTSASYKLDQTIPTITSVSVSKSIISNISGYSDSVLSFIIGNPGTADYISDISYIVKMNNSQISSGTTAGTKTLTINSSTAGIVEGLNTITITLNDVAGNSTSSTAKLTFDKTAPTATITDPSGIGFEAATSQNAEGVGTNGKWHNATTFTGIKLTSISEACNAYIWLDGTDITVTPPSGCSSKNVSGSVTVGKSDIYGVSGITDSPNSNYIHIKLIDSVANTTYYHKCLAYDATKPTAPNASFTAAAYNNTAVSITLTYKGKDATAGIVSYKINDVTTSTTVEDTWNSVVSTSGTMTINKTLTTAQGVHKYEVLLMDAAGNISPSTTISCEYDTKAPTSGITLRNPETTTQKNSPSNNPNVDILITLTDNDTTELSSYGKGAYKIWGNFTGSAANESTATWVSFNTGGSSSLTISKTATEGDGLKTFNIRVKDNAGNEGAVASASFTLDTAAPVVNAAVDYNRISKVHVERRKSITEPEPDKYCDTSIITAFIDSGAGEVSDEQYQAYKVCAYASQEAAIAGTASDTAITGCSGSGLSKSGSFTITVNGANLEKAVNGGAACSDHSKDGTYILVVYIQDKAGTWSKSAEF